MCLEANEQNVPTEVNETSTTQSSITQEQNTDNTTASADEEEDCGCGEGQAMFLTNGVEITKQFGDALDEKVMDVIGKLGDEIVSSQDLLNAIPTIFSKEEIELLAMNRISNIHREISEDAFAGNDGEPSLGEILAQVLGGKRV